MTLMGITVQGGGDWLNDFFEIEDDMLDGVRGNSASPIRYDDRTTT